MNKVPALLTRKSVKYPILAKLTVQEHTFYVVEVTCKGGPRYALGSKVKSGFHWVLGPIGKTELWTKMKEVWDITVE